MSASRSQALFKNVEQLTAKRIVLPHNFLWSGDGPGANSALSNLADMEAMAYDQICSVCRNVEEAALEMLRRNAHNQALETWQAWLVT